MIRSVLLFPGGTISVRPSCWGTGSTLSVQLDRWFHLLSWLLCLLYHLEIVVLFLFFVLSLYTSVFLFIEWVYWQWVTEFTHVKCILQYLAPRKGRYTPSTYKVLQGGAAGFAFGLFGESVSLLLDIATSRVKPCLSTGRYWCSASVSFDRWPQAFTFSPWQPHNWKQFSV